ncbi:MAG: hypothetical protein RL618_670 [Pseudomonadota bacterium]
MIFFALRRGVDETPAAGIGKCAVTDHLELARKRSEYVVELTIARLIAFQGP